MKWFSAQANDTSPENSVEDIGRLRESESTLGENVAATGQEAPGFSEGTVWLYNHYAALMLSVMVCKQEEGPGI
jgi:hypothetical protein